MPQVDQRMAEMYIHVAAGSCDEVMDTVNAVWTAVVERKIYPGTNATTPGTMCILSICENVLIFCA